MFHRGTRQERLRSGPSDFPSQVEVAGRLGKIEIRPYELGFAPKIGKNSQISSDFPTRTVGRPPDTSRVAATTGSVKQVVV